MNQPLFARRWLTGFIGDERNCKLHFTAFCLARSCAGVRRRPRSIFPPSSLTLLPLFESLGKGIKRMYQIEVLKSSRSRGKGGERLRAWARQREREERERERESEIKGKRPRKWSEMQEDWMKLCFSLRAGLLYGYTFTRPRNSDISSPTIKPSGRKNLWISATHSRSWKFVFYARHFRDLENCRKTKLKASLEYGE